LAGPGPSFYNLGVKVLVINGANMETLGQREPEVYGCTTLPEIEEIIRRKAAELGMEVCFFQSSSESAIIRAIHDAKGEFDGILINPASHTHYSVAIADAIKAVAIPAVEVHISNILAREGFRAHSVTARAARGVIAGFGVESYLLGLAALHHILSE